ncbi:MAG: FAD:protein FMN transferase, partial [Bacteriovoracia bacterium]
MKQYARASSSGTAANGPLRRLRPALGTFVEVTAQMAPGGDARTWQRSEVLQGLITQAFSGIANLEGVFSCFTPASELYRVNHAPVGEWIEISGELAEVLGFGARLEQASD